jgi:hypothetical protein
MGAVLIGISRGSRSTGPESRRARNAWSRRCVRLKQARGRRFPVDLVGALAHGGAVVPGLHAQQRVDPDCRTPSRCAGPSPATGGHAENRGGGAPPPGPTRSGSLRGFVGWGKSAARRLKDSGSRESPARSAPRTPWSPASGAPR